MDLSLEPMTLKVSQTCAFYSKATLLLKIQFCEVFNQQACSIKTTKK